MIPKDVRREYEASRERRDGAVTRKAMRPGASAGRGKAKREAEATQRGWCMGDGGGSAIASVAGARGWRSERGVKEKGGEAMAGPRCSSRARVHRGGEASAGRRGEGEGRGSAASGAA